MRDWLAVEVFPRKLSPEHSWVHGIDVHDIGFTAPLVPKDLHDPSIVGSSLVFVDSLRFIIDEGRIRGAVYSVSHVAFEESLHEKPETNTRSSKPPS